MPGRGRLRSRGRGRWSSTPASATKRKQPERNPKQAKEVEDDEEDNVDESKGGDTSQSDNNETIDDSKIIPKKRGRKRKAEIPQEEKYVPSVDPTQRGIMAQGGSLRRRDTLKSTSRYSPPPVTTRRYVKQEKAPNEKKSPEDSKFENSAVGRRKSSLGLKTEKKEEDRKEKDKKMVVTMPDGFDLKVEPPNKKIASVSPNSGVQVEKKDNDNDENNKKTDEEAKSKKTSDDEKSTKDKDKNEVESTTANESIDAAVVSEIPTKTRAARVIRRKSAETQATVTVTEKVKSPVAIIAEKTSSGNSTTSAPVTMSKTQTITISSNTQTISVSRTTTNNNTTVSAVAKLPTILKAPLTPTPMPTTNTVSKSPIRKPVSFNKYLETLPEIEDCIHNDGIPDANMEKMPDKILLVNSELPLPLAVSIDNQDENYLFRQIISPVNASRFVCLLCKGIDVNFATKEEKDILLHYQSLHELDVEIGQAKFSEDIVFICLPKMILNQFTNSNSLSLNSPCQYCNVRLSDISEMKDHYSTEHNKDVIMMEQEEIMQMHHYFYCSKCQKQSPDFDTHHKHMKMEHNLKTYRCKSCVLVTKDEVRLRTHFKAKHMLHNSGQNYQCYYCHGLLIGVERLQKHIQQSHMVQTSPSEYSCVACRKSCGKGKELLTHAQNCALAGIKPEKSEARFIPNLNSDPSLEEGERLCYFCSTKLESEEAYQLHLHHEHKKWMQDFVETVKSSDETNNSQLLTINDIITDDDLKRAKIQTYVGHWCRICDQMVKVYQLYYLHMVNFHKFEKVFQCVISTCKKTFKEFDEFKEHIEEMGHSQKTIISHPDEVFVCTYCDLYFASDEELTAHLITDQHINKFTASGHFHRTEPRNFKCKACHTFFGMKESYIHHLETESHQYVCIYCGITTATPSSRRAHIQNSHVEKLVLCEDCGECQSDIMAHFVIHGYTFECKKCIKKFYNRERLNSHMEVHQDPTECNWPDCGRMIATRSMLVTHYRGHKSEHKCSICGQAFWNYAMLTSHMRSHQPMPPRNNQSTVKTNQLGKATIQYANQTRANPTVLQRPRLINQPLLSNNVIRCGHCSNLFGSAKELSVHKCNGKIAINNGEQSKLFELASKASTQAKAVNKQPTKRRASPKKPPQLEQLIDLPSFQSSIEHQPMDEDTQLIMILNQSTGELMEITAPKGMEVQEVINSLNFAPGVEEVQMETVEEQPIQHQVLQITDDQTQPKTTPVESITAKFQSKSEQEETAAAIEIIEQVNDQEQVVESNNVVSVEQQPNNSVETIQQVTTTSEVLIEDNGQPIPQIIEDQNTQEQAIVLPSDCLNEDGTFTLDAETLRRLNLALQVDENGTLTTGDGNATFIIETTTIKEQ